MTKPPLVVMSKPTNFSGGLVDFRVSPLRIWDWPWSELLVGTPPKTNMLENPPWMSLDLFPIKSGGFSSDRHVIVNSGVVFSKKAMCVSPSLTRPSTNYFWTKPLGEIFLKQSFQLIQAGGNWWNTTWNSWNSSRKNWKHPQEIVEQRFCFYGSVPSFWFFHFSVISANG